MLSNHWRRALAAGAICALALALSACGEETHQNAALGHDDGHDDHDDHGGHDGHGDHDDHGGHDDHGDHGGHGDEARTVIPAEEAERAGIRTEAAGPATLVETVDVLGRVDFAPDARTALRARYSGKVLDVFKTVGDRVKEGERLARVESNASLQTYTVTAPMDGVILERNANRGDVTGEEPLFRIGDPARLHVDYHVFASDLAGVRPGQKITVRTTDGRVQAETSIAAFLPTKETATQTIIARAPLPNPDGKWIPGMTVTGDITVAETPVPLAVRTEALQRFRGETAVFAREGDAYEARSLKIGRQTPDWTEVLSGLEAGENYVSENSFLIKADIEKAGAAHHH